MIGLVVLFLGLMARFHSPGQGFSSLLMLGDHTITQTVPELRELDLFVLRDSPGYDAQHYVQLALRPDLRDPALVGAVDNLPYRARRMALSWIAWLVGGGEPGRIVQVYALLNVAAWLGLAGLLLRWLPASSWQNVFRWFAILFGCGAVFSVRGSLVDLPGLLALAAGVALIESRRAWAGALVLGFGGMIRETGVLGATALLPTSRSWRAWIEAAARAALAVGPAVAWLVYVTVTLGRAQDVGTRNFTWPFAGWWWAWQEAIRQGRLDLPFLERTASLWVVCALTVQALVILLRPRWREVWWRVGLAYVLLMIPLGELVWEGQPGAAARVLLPLTLAFNLLVPHERRWWPVLVLGNLTLLPSVLALPTTIPEVHRIEARNAELDSRPTGDWRVWYDQFWYNTEASRWGTRRWRWASGTASVVIFNPQEQPVVTQWSFELASDEERPVSVERGDEVLWRGEAGPAGVVGSIEAVSLPPGYSRWTFATPAQEVESSVLDPRPLAFRLKSFEIHVLGAEASQ